MSKKRTDANDARYARRRVRPFSFLLMCLLCATSVVSARQETGELGLILQPNIGRPALVEPGGSFEVVLRAKAELFLHSPEHRYELGIDWHDTGGRDVRGVVTVPSLLEPGAYTLEASADANPQAVYVFPEFPSRYTFVHVAQPHTDDDQDLAKLITEAVNRSQAQFVLLTGDLTAQGSADEFRRLLNLLRRIQTPTFVCPGLSDMPGGQYRVFFGEPVYTFVFGEDAFLSLGALRGGRTLTNGPGRLHRLRRQIKPARWSVGFVHGYRHDMDMRTQLSLFVDTPLDAIILGASATPDAGQASRTVIPWGKTSVHATGPLLQTGAHVIGVSETGLKSIIEAPEPPEV